MTTSNQNNVLTAEETALVAAKGDRRYMNVHTGGIATLQAWAADYTSKAPDEWAGPEAEEYTPEFAALFGPRKPGRGPVSLFRDRSGEAVLVELNETITYTFDGENPSDVAAKNTMPLAVWRRLMKMLARAFKTWPEDSRREASRGLDMPFGDWLGYTYSMLGPTDCGRYEALIRRLATGWEETDPEYSRLALRLASVMKNAFCASKALIFRVSDAA